MRKIKETREENYFAEDGRMTHQIITTTETEEDDLIKEEVPYTPLIPFNPWYPIYTPQWVHYPTYTNDKTNDYPPKYIWTC